MPPAADAAHDAPLVAVAANVFEPVETLAARFREETGIGVRLSVGSSGNLARQIERGAPFELFLCADEARVARLVEAGLTRDAGDVYAIGSLVLWVARDGTLRLPGEPGAALASPADLARTLAPPAVRRVAIANPEHAPYGKAARAALELAGAWALLSGRLVLGENVGQAARFAISPDVDAGLLPLSIALGEALGERGRYMLVPAQWHQPLRQRMVLLRDAGRAAEAFHAYLLGPVGREVLLAYGYAVP